MASSPPHPGHPCSCSEPRPLHMRPACSCVMLANIPTDPWQPLWPMPLRRDLPGLPHLVAAAISNSCLTCTRQSPCAFLQSVSLNHGSRQAQPSPHGGLTRMWEGLPRAAATRLMEQKTQQRLVLPHAALPSSCTPTIDWAAEDRGEDGRPPGGEGGEGADPASARCLGGWASRTSSGGELGCQGPPEPCTIGSVTGGPHAQSSGRGLEHGG